MKRGYYLIGEVSKITGISKDTLHFYDKIGLLTPDSIDGGNRYRYYSRFNLWQLDIITTCRKLSIPIERVKRILSVHDNQKITGLLMEYRDEALRLSAYYQRVADDILWYDEENKRISAEKKAGDVRLRWMEAETVIAGAMKRDESSYHANLQEAAKEALSQAGTIRRKYGYIIDPKRIKNGEFFKRREYLKIADRDYSCVNPENLYTIPAGDYAVLVLHIQNGRADFSPLLRWCGENGYTVDAIYADELGLQLFDYIDDYYCELKAHLTAKQKGG